jgi:DNA polymerase-3 subunit delta'
MNAVTPPAERWGIVGHDVAVATLDSAVASGRVPHALLITGPRGAGRTALALAFARALNCAAPPAERPCNTCDACRRITRRLHPDVVVADLDWQGVVIERPRGEGAQARRRLSIRAIRWLREDIVTRPLLGRWKVQIVDDADRLSDDAPDAFLKTLEEPPSFAVIVLIAGSVDDVPETIRSRCRHVALGSVASDAIRAALSARGVEQRDAAQLARAARGRAGWALAMAADAEALARHRAAIESACEHVTTPLGRIEVRGAIARDHTKKRDTTFSLVELWTGLWRDALLLRSGLGDEVAFPEVADRLSRYVARLELDDVYRALRATQRCHEDLETNVQARVALHAMVTQWPD